MRVKTYSEAVRLARSAGEDAANRRMRKAGRAAWSATDHDHAAAVTQRVLTDLGFDVAGWIAIAGVPRNEPEELKPARKRKPRRKTPVQLNFGFH
ncbi:MAG: hypothetical protein R3D33_02920 [Hyphomicrobiaceae bacterium]